MGIDEQRLVACGIVSKLALYNKWDLGEECLRSEPDCPSIYPPSFEDVPYG